jgi:hypothetical protein
MGSTPAPSRCPCPLELGANRSLFLAGLFRAVTAWCDLVACQEEAVEVRKIVESAGEGDIRHGSFTFQQFPCSPAEAEFDDVSLKGLADFMAASLIT